MQAAAEAGPSPSSGDFGLSEVVDLLIDNRLVIAVSVAITMTIAVVYLLTATPLFTATTLLLIDSRNSSLNSTQMRVTDANSDSAYVETQVGVLNSEHIVRTVIFEQKLYELPEFKSKNDPSPAPSADAAAADKERTFDIVPASAVKEFRKRLEIKRSPSTYIIDIIFTYKDPEKAAAIANAVAQAYIADQMKSREQAILSTNQWLRLRTADLRRETQAAETALDEFRSNNAVRGNSSRSILRDLESTAQSYRLISDSFQKRFLETSQQLYLLTPDARIVSKAWPPSDKSHPRSTLILAVAAALGLASGFLIAIVRSVTGGPQSRSED